MRTDASIFVFAAGAFLGLGLLWVSPTAALWTAGICSMVAVALVGKRRSEW